MRNKCNIHISAYDFLKSQDCIQRKKNRKSMNKMLVIKSYKEKKKNYTQTYRIYNVKQE